MLCCFILAYSERSDRYGTRKHISKEKKNHITQVSKVQDRTHHNNRNQNKLNRTKPEQDKSGQVTTKQHTTTKKLEVKSM
jgi:hypothetical protein